MNLTVANGYPVAQPKDIESATPDFDAVTQRYFDLGSALAADYSLVGAFQELYTTYVAFQGKHPQAAFDEVLRVLDIATPDDFIYYTDFDHG